MNKTTTFHFKTIQVALFMFVFQMLGVRIFQGIGFVLSVLILSILVGTVRLTKKRLVTCVLLAVFCAIFQFAKGTALLSVITVTFQIVNATLLAYYYASHNFVADLTPVLKVFAVQALITLIVDILVPVSLLSPFNNYTSGVGGYHLCYIFYIIPKELFMGIHRLAGWAWEPGCLQLLMNIYLFILIQNKKTKLRNLLWISLLVVATGSTSGYIILMLNFCIYLLSRSRSNFVWVCVLGALMVVAVLPFVWTNISGKLMLGTDSVDTSGVIRYRDFFTGLLCLRDYPIFGIDVTDLANNPVYRSLESRAIDMTKAGDMWYKYFDYAAGGYTNGFFGMTMMWGIMGLFLLYKFFRCSLWRSFSSKYYFIVPIIFFLSIVSEPISNTALFWFFCIFDIVNKTKITNHDIINNHSNVECRADLAKVFGKHSPAVD